MAEGSPGQVIGRNVRALREEQLLSRTELAERSGVSVPGIEHLERGISARPRRRTVEKLARALGFPVEDLISEEPPRPKVESRSSLEPSFNDVLAEERRPSRDLWEEAAREAGAEVVIARSAGEPIFAKMPQSMEHYMMRRLREVERGELSAEEAFRALVEHAS